jgi:polysaccharide biosynthesis/export protein
MCKSFIRLFLFSAISSFIFAACTNKKNLVYFQGSMGNSGTKDNYNPVFKADDVLSVTVLGLDPIATQPFNIPYSNQTQLAGGYLQGAPTQPGYLVDAQGFIDFPVIGKIKLGGLSRSAAIDTLKKQLAPYLSNPTILIRILNYKITVLGEVRNPGTFTIPNERVTLPEALGIAGDLLVTGLRKNVLVIRDVDGKKTETRVDLTSKDLFSSPVYYLNQNDLVYVEPNRTKINSSAVNASNVSLVVSVISLFVTMSILFTTKN